MTAVLTSDVRAREVDEGYTSLECAVRGAFSLETRQLFTTNVDREKLWLTYLDNLPGNRQHYNCNSCRRFIEAFCGLVTVDADGKAHTRWDAMLESGLVSSFFITSVSEMAKFVRNARVDGVFVSSEIMLGTPNSDKGWTHLSALNPKVYTGTLLTASQRAAELRQDYILLRATMEEFTLEQIQAALDILKSEQFPGYEKGVAIAEWYLQLRQAADIKNYTLRNNIIWARVASAPPGFAHLKNGMVGTLLEDIRTGKSFEQCRRAWADKMHPLQYKRPTAPVTEGQVQAAEKLFATMKLEPALKRRFADIVDLKGIRWVPRSTPKPTGASGVFGHLLDNPAAPSMQINGGNITWAKFSRDVLPGAYKIEIDCPPKGGYVAITTAADPDAPPILQWDSLENRNPASHYFYYMGALAAHFNVSPGWNEVTQVSNAPHGNTLPHFNKFIVFSVKGCYDTMAEGGIGLFPEFLRAELHQVRSVIEKYSNTAKVTPGHPGTAHGLAFSSSNTVRVRVNGSAIYTIDRWE